MNSRPLPDPQIPPSPDRRAVLSALAAVLSIGGARSRRPGLEGVLAPSVGPPMACAGLIARRGDGSVAMRAAAGVAGGSLFTPRRPFRVASVSKMVATSAFLPLVLRTGLDLDADASAFVGFRLRHPAHPDTAITPRMLLSHTSGPRNGPSYPVPRLSEAFEAGGRRFDADGWFGPAGDAFFGAGDGDWRGHFGDAYGWITGLFWNRRDGRTLVYAIHGCPRETGHQPAAPASPHPKKP